MAFQGNLSSTADTGLPCLKPVTSDPLVEDLASLNSRLSPTLMSLENAEHEINVNDFMLDMRLLLSGKLVRNFVFQHFSLSRFPCYTFVSTYIVYFMLTIL